MSEPSGATMMRAFVIALVAACGGQSASAPSNQNTTPIQGPNEARTPIEKRRDDACDALAPKITHCAVDDAKANLAAGKITQAQYNKDAAPEVVRKNSDEYATKCKGQQLSSRQVRVLEVCFKAESECGPLLACLDNVKAK
jgi:hypothetical protein